MSSHDFVQLLVQLAVLLATAMLCGQAMRALRQPSVMGELARRRAARPDAARHASPRTRKRRSSADRPE